MLKLLYGFLKENAKMELFMAIVLLVSVTAIACNMEKVVERQSESESVREIKQNGKTVVIDPGHGGKDPGKVGVNGAKEKDVNLAIAKELEKVLIGNGFNVVLTRKEDIALSGNGKFSKIGDLNERCRIINDTYLENSDTILISIHQNSFTTESVHGAQVFYYQRSENSRMLADVIQAQLNVGINTDKAKTPKSNDSYYMLINSKCSGVIIECGFLSNHEEAAKLIDSEYHKKMSNIICNGIKEYFNVEK